MESLFEINSTLQYRVKALQQQVDEFRSGERYKKLQHDYSLVIDGFIKEIARLKKEKADAEARAISTRNIWFDECESNWKDYQTELNKKEEAINRLEERYWRFLRAHDEEIAKIKAEHRTELEEKDAIIEKLKDELAHEKALNGRDSNNTSLPTSKTPIGKEKRIPNSRRGTGKKKGGQPGHTQHKMAKPSMDEIDDVIDHCPSAEEVCPTCGSDNLKYTGEYEEKYEIDVEVKVTKKLHRYFLYECEDCGEIVRTGIDPNHRAECQYGPNVQAIALSLMNSTNAAINKVPLFLSGITKGEIKPCEGYIAKLQPRAAKRLRKFRNDLYVVLIQLKLLYWDDTVALADKKRICLRFYGNEFIAFYVAHDQKNMKGILEDGILEALTADTKVMHDHNSINYNKRFIFINIECNAHIQRDLQKIIDDTGHTEPKELKDLISISIKERNDLIDKECDRFDGEYIKVFNEKLTDILERAKNRAIENKSIYTVPFERAVISRIIEYRENFFAWIYDFSIPTTNNLSERSLRGIKTKMKVSGQFASTDTADNYALIRTYIETCRRNGINEIEALSRLCNGNPYTVEEIFSSQK